jgi:hypothetical protein
MALHTCRRPRAAIAIARSSFRNGLRTCPFMPAAMHAYIHYLPPAGGEGELLVVETTEFGEYSAYYQSFSNGGLNYGLKSSTFYVRAIRSF